LFIIAVRQKVQNYQKNKSKVYKRVGLAAKNKEKAGKTAQKSIDTFYILIAINLKKTIDILLIKS